VHKAPTDASALPKGTPLFAVDLHTHTPYTEQWHLNIQREILRSTTLTVAYIGNRGVHIDGLVDINEGPLNGPGSSIAKNRPYPTFGQIYDLQTNQVSSYNALQITAERRARNLSFLVSYTHSHSLDENTAGSSVVLNSYNPHSDYGNSDYNIPNRLVATVNYKLPFHGSGALRPVVEGWQVNTIFSYFSGIPFSVTSSALGDGGITERANLLPGFGNGSLPAGKRSVNEWFNPAAFATPATGQWGNSGRNILEGPGTNETDFSVFKDIRLAEAKSLQIRTEIFNLFNTPQFNNPSASTLVPSTIGTISSAGSPSTLQRTSREIQLAAKITF
jgi:hypothetical protein